MNLNSFFKFDTLDQCFSSFSDANNGADRNETEFLLVENFVQTIPKVEFEGGAKLDTSSNPKRSKKEERALSTITFEDVNEEVEADTKGYPWLSKYLSRMLKGGNKIRLISVFGYANDNVKVEVNNGFLQKLEFLLKDPTIFISLRVYKSHEKRSIKEYYWNGEKGMAVKDLLRDGQEFIYLIIEKPSTSSPSTFNWTGLLDLKWTVKIKFDNGTPRAVKIKEDGNEVLKNMYELDDKDVNITVANGKGIKCHRLVLMAQSAPLRAMLSKENGMIEGESGRVDLKENSEEGVRKFVEFLYGFEILTWEISADLCIELLQLANKYEVKKLESLLIEFILANKMDCADSVLELYFLTRNVQILEELRDHALIELSRLPEQKLKACEYYKTLKPTDREDLLFRLLESSRN